LNRIIITTVPHQSSNHGVPQHGVSLRHFIKHLPGIPHAGELAVQVNERGGHKEVGGEAVDDGMRVQAHAELVIGGRGDGEGIGEVIGGEAGVFAEMGVEGNGEGVRREGEAFDDDVEEEDVGFGNREEEGTCVVRGADVEELLGELGNGGEVVVVTVADELRVGFGKVREGAGFVDEGEERVAANVPTNHLNATHHRFFYL